MKKNKPSIPEILRVQLKEQYQRVNKPYNGLKREQFFPSYMLVQQMVYNAKPYN